MAMKIATQHYLKPCADSQKSYYRKAIVKYILDDNIKRVILQSYDTDVCYYDATDWSFHSLWNGYSKTTMRHINSFRVEHEGTKLSKKEWETMEVETI